MTILCELRKELLPMAVAEAAALLSPKSYKHSDSLLIMEAEPHNGKRLSLTKSLYLVLFSTKRTQLDEVVKDVDWEAYYKGSFCVEIKRSEKSLPTLDKHELGKAIWAQLGNPVVDLENPGTRFVFFISGHSIICALHLFDTDTSYLRRKAHQRPGFHPVSLSPRLARACVNLTGLRNGTLLDPFCGTGGILIEAGLMGLKVIGSDIDSGMLDKTQMNLVHYGIEHAQLYLGDAAKGVLSADAIVTDIPYARNTKKQDLAGLVTDFLRVSFRKTKIMVLILPDFLEHQKIIEMSPWSVSHAFSYYLHKSLSKKIYVLIPQ